MNKEQLKPIQENIRSLREVAMELLNNKEADREVLARIIEDRLIDIELELYVTEEMINLFL